MTTILPPPIGTVSAKPLPAAASNFTGAHTGFDSQRRNGAGDSSSPDTHRPGDSHSSAGVGGPILPPPIGRSSAKRYPAAASTSPDTQQCSESQRPIGVGGPILADNTLAMCADVVEDLEAVRIANENRLRQLTDTTERGSGLTLDHPDVMQLAVIIADLAAAEHKAILNLQRAMRKHPLGPWVKATPGVGEKQAARLLASIRDPYWHDADGKPRTLRQLWRFCGLDVIPAQDHDGSQIDRGGDGVVPTDTQAAFGSQAPDGVGVAPQKRRGQQVTWNPAARQRVWLIAASCIKQTSSPYREVYDMGRIKYADALHDAPCVRCGPSGKPAQVGSPLSAGHQHARAMRLMCKEILRDIWREAKRIHEQVEE